MPQVSRHSATTITTLLFDCDNTLVLSEELAFEACADLINEICEGRQIEQRFTGEKLIVEFVGQNFRGMMMGLQKRYGFEMEADELETYVRREEDAVIAKLKAALRPCPGVDDQLERLQAEGKYKLSVVSSSAKRRVWASIVKVGQDKYFKEEEVFSAATSLPKPTSKPDPAIYLWAMEKLGKKPEECVAIEDSKSGTLSGTRAGIKVIGYVGPYPDDKKAEMEKVLRDAGAVVIMQDWTEFPDVLAKIESGSV
ncbi:haloacid dehalogenase-like hydrolase [Colletotrichum karsti]|uniref:Haloacid dehalogenase-like hydrolase n=1 Tax=Colletotrichum karsti TaxID=1095194 RepID=A0A9P6LQU5_9PEZI|nr:haloacid dehalogenase-like hydrolase [Colletotrichum karsti]KAF9881207.1 haloacid dehalogenase-like hydrolase [Colletotrichum karsti]